MAAGRRANGREVFRVGKPKRGSCDTRARLTGRADVGAARLRGFRVASWSGVRDEGGGDDEQDRGGEWARQL